MIYVDTNCFLRYLLEDNVSQHQQVLALFEKASAGAVTLVTSVLTVLEIVWVLRSVYDTEKEEMISYLKEIMELSYILIPDKECIITAIDIFQRFNVGFEDSLHLAYAKQLQVENFESFDKKLLKTFALL